MLMAIRAASNVLCVCLASVVCRCCCRQPGTVFSWRHWIKQVSQFLIPCTRRQRYTNRTWYLLPLLYIENIVQHHYMYTSMEKKEEMCSLIYTHSPPVFPILYFRFDSFVSLSSRVHWNRLPTNKVSDFISASRRGVIPIVFRMESISLLCWNDATVYIVLFYTIPPERNF